jgi:hypothetical protein
MASSNHDDIKNFMRQAAVGDSMPVGKKMVYNKVTRKWEVISGNERPGDSVPQVSVEDMRAFTHA